MGPSRKTKKKSTFSPLAINKKSTKSRVTLSNSDENINVIEETRKSSKEALYKGFISRINDSTKNTKIEDLISTVEQNVFHINHGVNPQYRQNIRSHLFSIKDKNNDICEKLLNGSISPQEFAAMSTKELASSYRKTENSIIEKEVLKEHIAEPLLPEDITKSKDGRTRAKWGVEKSAAAIDSD